jgi:UDP-glucose 4-epimerase
MREIASGRYATLIALFAEKMKSREPLSVVAPGTQQRNFTHIDDIVDGLVLVGEKGYGDGYGLGSSEAYSILEVAELFGGKIEILPERRGNRMAAEVKTDKTRALGWEPQRRLNEYIESLKDNSWNKE